MDAENQNEAQQETAPAESPPPQAIESGQETSVPAPQSQPEQTAAEPEADELTSLKQTLLDNNLIVREDKVYRLTPLDEPAPKAPAAPAAPRPKPAKSSAPAMSEGAKLVAEVRKKRSRVI